VRQPSVPQDPVERRPALRFSIVRDILIAPQRAYAEILVSRSWLPAYFVVLCAGFIDLAAAAPAVTHLASLLPGAKHLSATQAEGAARAYVGNAALYNAVQPPLIWGLIAMTFASVARFKKQAVPFSAFFALAAAASVPSALGELVDAIGSRLHDPASYQSIKALVTTVPDNFALLAANGNDREVEFLANFGLFDIWSTLLLAYGFVAFARVKLTTALALSFSLDIFFALVFSTP
jgi:hypothetical protein